MTIDRSGPRTEAGKALLRRCERAHMDRPEDAIAAIEDQAAAIERARIAERVRGINPSPNLKHKADHPASSYDPLLRETAVLAAIEGEPK